MYSWARVLAAFHFDPSYYLIPWVVAIDFLVYRITIDCYIGWRWTKGNQPPPKLLHWVVGYLVFFGVVVFWIVWHIISYISAHLHYVQIWVLLKGTFGVMGYDFYMVLNLFSVIGPYFAWTLFGLVLPTLLESLLFGSYIIIAPILPVALFYTGVKIAKRDFPFHSSHDGIEP